MQIQSISLLSSPYSSSSVGAPQSISVGQRASLPTQRQGLSVSNVVKPLLAVLEHLKPARFPEHQRQALLGLFSENQHQEIKPLLNALRGYPLSTRDSVGEDVRDAKTLLILPLFKPQSISDVQGIKQISSSYIGQLNNLLRSLNDSTFPASCFCIAKDEYTDQLSLLVSLKHQTPKHIQTILTHLPAIIKALMSVRA
jgi:hypothetical protein